MPKSMACNKKERYLLVDFGIYKLRKIYIGEFLHKIRYK